MDSREYEKAIEHLNKRVFWIRIIFGILLVIIVVVGIATGGISISNAHTPCNDVYRQPDCQYVQVVNPVTGELEQHYVCN